MQASSGAGDVGQRGALMLVELIEQMKRLARALDQANRSGNDEAAKIHHTALLEIIDRILEQRENENEK